MVMKLNFTHNFFKKQFLPIQSSHCTILIVQSLAQGLPSKFPGERAARPGRGAGGTAGGGRRGSCRGSWREQEGQVSWARENGASFSNNF